MNRFFLLFGLIPAFLIACNNEPEKKISTGVDTTLAIQQPSVNPADDASAKAAAIRQIDALEKLFSNDNFLLVDGKDSSYLYFSRLGKNSIFTHSYKMIKGDSANLKIDTIQIGNDNKLHWNLQGKQLILNNATDYISTWKENNKGNNKIEFQRIDNKTIRLIEGEKKMELHKTLVLSLFLVRSYYDYQHGTNYAQDSIDTFKPKVRKAAKNK